MTTIGDDFAHWDASYVLGALSPEERREFEEHLSGCLSCQQAVSEIAGLPGLLAQVAPEDAAIWSAAPPSGPDSSPPENLLPDLLSRARGGRRRVLTVLVGVAAGLVLLLGGIAIGAHGLTDPPPTPPTTSRRLAFSAVLPSSLTAVADVVPGPAGTRIDVECQYGEASQTEPGREYPEYSIVVVDRSGRTTRIKDWYVKPERVMHPSAITPLAPAQIDRIEIRRTDTDQTLLQTTLR